MRGGAVLLGLGFALSLVLVNPYVRGDGNGYYAYVVSAVIDGDLDFENQFRRGDPAFRALYFEGDALRAAAVTSTGRVWNQWAVGASILWAPFFLAAHAATGVANAFGAALPADGYAWPYRWACALSSALYGFLALGLACAAAARTSGAHAALAATAGIWLASSLAVYMYFVPFHVHALAAFTAALFLWYWLERGVRTRPSAWAVWGLLGGLMIEVYQLNAVLLMVPLAEAWRIAAARSGAPGRHGGPWRALLLLSAFAGAALLALVPHFAVKWAVNGSPLDTGYRDRFFWTSPRLWQVGFSPEHGLFLWTPVVALALAGLVCLCARRRREAAVLLAVVAAFAYVVASYQNWHGQSSYGSRFFVSLTLPFVLGLAELIRRASAWRPLGGIPAPARVALVWTVAVLPLLVWNVGLMFQWGTNLVPNRGPVDLRVVAHNQVTEVPARLAGFLRRYLTERDRVVREVEESDLDEIARYRVRR